MSMKLTFLTVGMFLAAGLLVLLSGCDEVESAALGPSISPESATISKGQTIQFTASDGFTYTWSLSDNTAGMLSNTDGPTTTYTSLQGPASGSVEVQVLKVTSTIEGAQGDGQTNGTGFARTAEAYIRHVDVAVSPGTVEIKPGQSVTFRATDGTSYQWSLLYESWGALSTRSGNTTTYTAYYDPPTNSTATSTQVLTVRSFDSEDSATITHVSSSE